ncbi:hypothetical protein EVG20_g10088 [Dentipellis fragilis]|uniref:Uncharacterized protein n=1 Tax=Dentipellis fragilis TaxID=205917 RepID=A0A4Y9XVP3_9AGAM|nr:hypothetical protein EVG20_g10088 [Dentipellis fragilis]
MPSLEFLSNPGHPDHNQVLSAIPGTLAAVRINRHTDLQQDCRDLNFIEWNFGSRIGIHLYIQIKVSFDIDQENFVYEYTKTQYLRFDLRYPSPATILDPNYPLKLHEPYGVFTPSPLPPPTCRSHRIPTDELSDDALFDRLDL